MAHHQWAMHVTERQRLLNTATNPTNSIIKKNTHRHTDAHTNFLHQMSNVPVNTRHQLPHNPNLISHLVHINNPPSRSRGQLRQNHSAFLPPLVHPLIYIRTFKKRRRSALAREQRGKEKKNPTRKHSVFNFLV